MAQDKVSEVSEKVIKRHPVGEKKETIIYCNQIFIIGVHALYVLIFFKVIKLLKINKRVDHYFGQQPPGNVTELHIQVFYQQQVVLQSQTHQNSPSSCTVTPIRSLSLLLTLCHSSELHTIEIGQ